MRKSDAQLRIDQSNGKNNKQQQQSSNVQLRKVDDQSPVKKDKSDRFTETVKGDGIDIKEESRSKSAGKKKIEVMRIIEDDQGSKKVTTTHILNGKEKKVQQKKIKSPTKKKFARNEASVTPRRSPRQSKKLINNYSNEMVLNTQADNECKTITINKVKRKKEKKRSRSPNKNKKKDEQGLSTVEKSKLKRNKRAEKIREKERELQNSKQAMKLKKLPKIAPVRESRMLEKSSHRVEDKNVPIRQSYTPKLSKRKNKDEDEYRDYNYYSVRKQVQQRSKIDHFAALRQLNTASLAAGRVTTRKRLKELPIVEESSRPKRAATKKGTVSYDESGKSNTAWTNYERISHSTDYTMITPKKYASEEDQPIEVHISLECLIMMTVHAHYFNNEIIGYLGGYFITVPADKFESKKKQVLYLHHCYPLERLKLDERGQSKFDGGKNVEMDPHSAAQTGKAIMENGEKLLAWYHSHPIFGVSPSKIDIANHINHQECFKREGSPYIAFIIGPYSSSVSETSCRSLLKCFIIENNHPYELKVNIIPSPVLSIEFMDKLVNVMVWSYSEKDQVDLKEK